MEIPHEQHPIERIHQILQARQAAAEILGVTKTAGTKEIKEVEKQNVLLVFNATS